MTTDKELKGYLDGWIARFENEKQEAETEKANIEATILKLEAKLKFLRTPIPMGACPRCYCELGVIVPRTGIPADPSAHGIDLFTCKNGHEY